MNFIDKAVAAFSPVKGLQRMAARKQLDILNTGYSNSGANKTKKSLRGWFFRGGSVKEDIEDNLDTLTQRARDLYMNTPLATGALKTIRTNVVGAGLVLNSQIDREVLGMTEEEADAWETQVEREFSLWANSLTVDAMQMHNFYELQQVAFLSFLASGEVFSLLPYRAHKEHWYGLRVQLIESDRVNQPTGNHKHIFRGVELGHYGEVVAYHICNVHPLSTNSGQKKWVRVEKFGKKTGRPNVLHLMESERPGQRRGVPILAPVIESLKQLDRYSEAELIAALFSSLMTVFIERSEDDYDEGKPIGEAIAEEEQIDPGDETSLELAPGSVIALAPGEKANTSNPARNNTSFDPFVTALGTEVLYSTQKTLAEKVSKAISEATGSGLLNRGAKFRNDLGVLKKTIEPAILPEICFVNSTVDAAIYRRDFEKICNAIAAVLAEEIGFTLKQPAVTPVTSGGIMSPPLKAETELTLNSTARRKMIVEFAIKQGAHVSWKTKLENRTITNEEIQALAMKAIVDFSK